MPPTGSAVRRPRSVTACIGVGTSSFVGGNAGNVAAGSYSGVLSGFENDVCDDDAQIVGGYQNAISSGANSAYMSFIGAGKYNVISGTADQSFVGAGYLNAVTGPDSVIGGGSSNQNAATNAMLGGGQGNTISSAATDAVLGGGSTNTVSAQYGVIAGGLNNAVSGEGAYIAAGGYNTASGEGAVVDGGFNSKASGTFATIPGGYLNNAAGTFSFAAGARASAAQNGTFVWSDGSDGDTILTSARAYEFLARAAGGFTLWTNAASTVGATLAPGSGTWASASDRNLKSDVVALDDADVLAKVAALPVSSWSYKSERGVRHVGPMAQDFYAAFGVGEDDKHITSIDEDGVALAAIKALRAENARLLARQAKMQQQLERLAAAVSTLRAQHP